MYSRYSVNWFNGVLVAYIYHRFKVENSNKATVYTGSGAFVILSDSIRVRSLAEMVMVAAPRDAGTHSGR